MIIIFISIISIFLGLLHLVVYKAIVSIFSFTVFWRLIVGIFLAIFCLSFILASILSFNLNNLFTRVYYTISAIWLGLAFYLFLASFIYSLVLVVLRIFNIVVSVKEFGVFCFTLAFVVSVYGVIHARSIHIKNVDVALPHLSASWEGKKAVWISDVHLGAVNGEDFAKKIVDKINIINPDIVFIGGDLYDGVMVNEAEVIKPFTQLHPSLGTYFITGNHEEFRDVKRYLNPINNIGIRVLNNEMATIDGLQLIGVDDRDSISVNKFKTILLDLNINKNEPSILLKHQPSQLEEAAEAGISFQISGHTHRAQVFPLNIFTSLIFKAYDYGLRMYNDTAVYTSSGVGTWGPPLRVGSDSEIVVFKFSLK